ncbi:uncharacterized protein LOC103937461 [Pyrus x bretschneideri]|uniref:uncharacterized protein LOC103937461 n=1 Tax=Pyrus x bretschneideri TaxID=225117 RepID=UPI00202EDC76|nr:uncharacterized protein LOC103937461 [Pyrus x bretschneideri]
MNDSTGTTASSLAIAEKKTHRPGGCVGIFFQLFDWNRRFAKKKLFSKKLLPPSRANKVSKKFRDEKMPVSKLHLIADENRGGFPNAKKNVNRSFDFEHKHELRAPSLVARLMGLESMPATHEKPKKASFANGRGSGEKTFVNNHSGNDRDELNLETENAKPESRPQKLQKMGPYEKRAVTRFGAEALQIKSVLSRSRKHHPKLASPLKSSSISSGKNSSRTSRLIDAATRILEPGLQSTNRAKGALTYSRSFHYPSVDEVVEDGTAVQSPGISNQACYNGGAVNSMMGQTSCKSCGNIVDVDVTSNVEEQQPAFPSFASNLVNSSSLVAEQRPKSSISSFGQENDAIFQGSRNQPVSVHGQKKILSIGEPVTEGKCLPPEGLASWRLSSSQPCKPQNGEASSITSKNRSQMQHRMSLGRERIPPRSKLNSLDGRRASSAANAVRGTKDFVALNRNLSGRAQPRVPTKVNDSKLDTERKTFPGKDDYPSQLRTTIRKRRMINDSGQVESSGFVSSTSTRQENYQFDKSTGKGLGNGAHLMDHTSARNKLAGRREGNKANGNKDTDVISFTFNSPIRKKTGNPTGMQGTSTDNCIKSPPQEPLPLSGDDIGALLEQKLRELACQEDDDMATGASSKRSTAMILQELISALSADRSLSHDGHMANTDIASPVRGKTDRSVGIFHDGHHLSPGSVLEASFSSSSLDDSSGNRSVYPHSTDYSDDQLQMGHDTDSVDSATSVDKNKTGGEIITALFNNVLRILHSIDAGGERLSGGKLTHANEVILNAELLFGDVTLHNKGNIMEGLFISPLLLDLETIADTMMTKFCVFSSFGDIKELGEFLFDFVIEYLDSKYGRCCNSGFRVWKKLPVGMNQKLMIQEVREEIQKWTDLAGMIPDELIEWDMSHSLGKWTDFNTEAFEIGSKIDGDILQSLVDEVVIDFFECQLLGSF